MLLSHQRKARTPPVESAGAGRREDVEVRQRIETTEDAISGVWLVHFLTPSAATVTRVNP